MPRNCSRRATLATWTILSVLWGGLASGQLAEDLPPGGKSAYGGPADVVVVSIYDARKNEAGGRRDGYALKRLIQAPSELEIAGNDEGSAGEEASRGIIRPSEVAAAGFIGTVLPSGNGQDAASWEATYGEYREAEESGRSGSGAGEANNSIEGAYDVGEDAEEAGEASRGNYRTIGEATIDPDSSWIFGRAIKRAERGSKEADGYNGATSSDRRGAGSRKIETSPRRDAQRWRMSGKSLAIGLSRSFGRTRHGGRRSRREILTGGSIGERIDRERGNGDNVRENLQFEDLIPKISGGTSLSDLPNELRSAATDCDSGRVSAEKITFRLVTPASRDLGFLSSARDSVYRSIVRQTSANWHHSVPESYFNYESSILTPRKFYPREEYGGIFRIYSTFPTSSNSIENTVIGKEIGTTSRAPMKNYIRSSAVEIRAKRNAGSFNFFETSTTPSFNIVEESSSGRNMENNRIARGPGFESRKNSLNAARDEILAESWRQNEILDSKPHRSPLFTAGGEKLKPPMPSMDGTQVYETTGVGFGSSTESKIVRDATPTYAGKLTVAPDYPEKDDDRDPDERLGKTPNSFPPNTLARSLAQSEAWSSVSTPEYHAQSAPTKTILGLSYAGISQGTALNSLAGEKKLNDGKRVQSKWQLYGDLRDQAKKELTYIEPRFSRGAKRTSGNNVRTNILRISSASCTDQNGNQIPARRKNGSNGTECAGGSFSGKLLDTERHELVAERREGRGEIEAGSEAFEHSQATVSSKGHNRHLANPSTRSRDTKYSASESPSHESTKVWFSTEMAEESNESDSPVTPSPDLQSSVGSNLPAMSSFALKNIPTLITEDSGYTKTTGIPLDDITPTLELLPIPHLDDADELSRTPTSTTPAEEYEDESLKSTTLRNKFNFSESSEITGARPWRSPASSAGESNSEETVENQTVNSSPDPKKTSAHNSVHPATEQTARFPSDAGRNSTYSRYDTSDPIASTPIPYPEGVTLVGPSASTVRNAQPSSENSGVRWLRGKKVESPARNPSTDDGSVSGPIHAAWSGSSPRSSPTKNPDGQDSVSRKWGNDVPIESPRSSASIDTRAMTLSAETTLARDSNTDEDVISDEPQFAAVASGMDSAPTMSTLIGQRTSAKFDGTTVPEKLAEASELSSRKTAGLNKEPLDGITARLTAYQKDFEDSGDRQFWLDNDGDDGDDDEVTLPSPLTEPLGRPSKRSGAKLSASGATALPNARSDATSAMMKISFEPLVSDKARATEGTSTMVIDFGSGFVSTLRAAVNGSLAGSEETLVVTELGSGVKDEMDEYGSTVATITRVSSSTMESDQFSRMAHLPDPGNAAWTKDFPLTTVAVSVKGSENSSQDEASLNQWPVKRSAVVEGDLILGGLMMVHEREDTVTCGPVMPQGGVQALEAMLYTLDTLNDMGIVPGVKIGAHILDDCDKDTYGLEMAVDFIKGSISNIDGAEYHCNKTAVRKVISGVVGAASSVTSIQVANLLRLFRIPQVSFFSTSPELSNKQRFEYFTRTIPSDHYQVKAMVDIVLTMGWSYVSIIYEESNYGIKAFEELEELLAKNEICIAIKEKLVKDSGVAEETAYDNIVLKLLTKPRARGCIIFGSDQEVAGVMRAVRRCNATGAFSWIGSDGWSARGLVSNGNEPEVEGTLSVQPQANPVKGFEEYFLNLTVENNRRNPWFVEFWEDHFQCRYPNASRTPYNQKYTKMCTTKERLTKQNTAFEDQLQFVSDAVMAFAYAFRDMHMDLCGGKAGLCDAMKPTNGTELLKYLWKVDFEGLSGDKFKFDKNGDGPARYNIIHFKQTEPGRYKWIRVGKYLQGELRLNMSEIQFKLGHPQPPESVCSLPCEVGQPKKYVEGERCCWHCFNCTQYQIRHSEDETQCTSCREGTLPDETHSACRDIPEEFLRTESGWAIGAMSFSATGILVTLFVAGVFVRHNETPIVRASGRELSYVLLLGILLCYLVTFALVLKPSDIVCGIQRFAVGFCFTVVYAALLTKTNRIARIFNASKHSAKRPSLISPRSQLIICSGLVGIQILINGVWMVIDPARAIHHYPTREDNLLVCNSYIDASYMIAFAYPIMLIVVCTVYAVITRKIPEAFNESKHIGFTMYTTCVIWLAFVPLYFGTGNHVALRITSMSVTISLSASVTIACLFSPKLYIILIRPERNVRQSMMIGKYGTTKGSAATTNASSMMAPVALTAATCDQNKAVKKHIIATIDCSTQSEYYELEVKDQKNGKPPANVMSRSTQTQVSNNEKDTNPVVAANKEKESAATVKPITNNARIGNGPVTQSDVSL